MNTVIHKYLSSFCQTWDVQQLQKKKTGQKIQHAQKSTKKTKSQNKIAHLLFRSANTYSWVHVDNQSSRASYLNYFGTRHDTLPCLNNFWRQALSTGCVQYSAVGAAKAHLITEAHYFGDCCNDATTLQLYIKVSSFISCLLYVMHLFMLLWIVLCKMRGENSIAHLCVLNFLTICPDFFGIIARFAFPFICHSLSLVSIRPWLIWLNTW